MKTKFTYLILLIGVVLQSCTQKTDWNDYFESQYHEPYGTKVLRNELEEHFPYSDVENLTQKTKYEIENYIDLTTSTYVYINKQIYLDHETMGLLIDWSMRGNSLFFSTEHFNDRLFSRFGLKTVKMGQDSAELKLTYIASGDMHYTLKNRNKYISYFSTKPEGAQVLGTVLVDGIEKPNFLLLQSDDGLSRIFVHAEPRYFSNYYMLKSDDGEYALSCLSYIDNNYTFLWDGYRTAQRFYLPDDREEQEGSSKQLFDFSMKSKSLTAALLILILAIVLFLSFNYKRVLRSLPIYRPLENNSIAFMKTVAILFMNHPNHKDLANYRLLHILDILRTKYHLDTSELDNHFEEQLSIKAQIDIKQAQIFSAQLRKVKRSTYLNREEFNAFNKVIERYIKKLDLYHGNKPNK